MGQMNGYGEPVSLSHPLAEGRHSLLFRRRTSDGRISEMTYYDLFVDTLAPDIIVDVLAPKITLRDSEWETSFPRVSLELTMSENVRYLYINGELRDFGSGWPYVLKSVDLEMGENLFELRAVSFAGHETTRTVTITRQGEIPEHEET